MMTHGLGCFKSSEAKKPLMCPKQSPSGTEVYQYPSPLHAVALQGPILLQGRAGAEKPVLLEGPGAPENVYDSLQMGSGTLSYIDKLLQRGFGKTQQETGTIKPEDRFDVKSNGHVHEASRKCASQAKANVIPPIGDQQRWSSRQEPTHKTNQKPGAPDGLSRYSAATKDHRSDEAACSSLKKNHKPQGENAKVARSCSDKKCHSEPREKRNPGVSQSFGSPELVHAMFVPAGSQRRQADRRTKSAKLRPRGGGAKPRAAKHQHGLGAERCGAEAKWKGRATNRANACPDLRQRSGLVSTPNGPGLKVQPRDGSAPAFAKLGRSCGPRCLEYEHPAERRRRQAASKWRSDVDICHAPYLQRSKDSRLQASESVQTVCSVRAKSGRWIGPQQPFQFPVYSGSFLHAPNPSYPPAPVHASAPHPPRCESEYSAECPSLFHSTIAESSEGEASDHTTNRFGDSESSRSLRSCSDSDSSLSPEDEEEEERGLVWAEASPGPPQQLPARPEPSTCRIKASRALKKKIRRFQPASLKVMTLV